MKPDHLTAIGLVGTVMIAFGFMYGFFYPNYLILVVLGFIVNWFGDSFDGSIARYRKKTRPNYGYYIDKIMDSIAVLILVLGLGLSGFAKIEVALLFACTYFILMFHVDLVSHVQNKTQNSFGLIGPTEVRIIGIMLTVYIYFADTVYINVYGHIVTQYDIAVLALSGIMFLIALVSIAIKGRELHKLDTVDW